MNTLPWVLLAIMSVCCVVLFVRRHRVIGRGKHSAYDEQYSVSVLTEIAEHFYGPRDEAARAALADRLRSIGDNMAALELSVNEVGGRHHVREAA